MLCCHRSCLFLLFFIHLCVTILAKASGQYEHGDTNEIELPGHQEQQEKHGEPSTNDEKEVLISPECAVVLITAGATAGTAASIVLAGPVLSLFGFTSVGVAQGSFAAWWQSTLPLIKAGSLFASLQSVAMSGVGSTVLITSSVGGAVAASKLSGFCEMIDKIDPDSQEGKIISSLVVGANNLESVTTVFKEEVLPKITPSEDTTKVWKDGFRDLKATCTSKWNIFKTEMLPKYKQKGVETKKILVEKFDEVKTYGKDTWKSFKVEDVLIYFLSEETKEKINQEHRTCQEEKEKES